MNYNNAIEKTILFIESHLTASFTVEDAAGRRDILITI